MQLLSLYTHTSIQLTAEDFHALKYTIFTYSYGYGICKLNGKCMQPWASQVLRNKLSTLA